MALTRLHTAWAPPGSNPVITAVSLAADEVKGITFPVYHKALQRRVNAMIEAASEDSYREAVQEATSYEPMLSITASDYEQRESGEVFIIAYNSLHIKEAFSKNKYVATKPDNEASGVIDMNSSGSALLQWVLELKLEDGLY